MFFLINHNHLPIHLTHSGIATLIFLPFWPRWLLQPLCEPLTERARPLAPCKQTRALLQSNGFVFSHRPLKRQTKLLYIYLFERKEPDTCLRPQTVVLLHRLHLSAEGRLRRGRRRARGRGGSTARPPLRTRRRSRP